MKNVYFALAVLFLGFTSCKNSDSTNDDTTAVDTTAVQQETMATTDSLNTTVPDSSATTTDSASAAAECGSTSTDSAMLSLINLRFLMFEAIA